MTDTFDVIVIGGGPTGEVCAGRLVDNGLRVALVERALYGGECSYWACMPSKALLRPGQVLAAAKRVPGSGVTGAIDPGEVFARRDAFTSHWDDRGQLNWVEQAGITAVRGHGVLSAPREVIIDDDRVLTAEHAVVLATGSSPKRPHLQGLDELDVSAVWSSQDATSASAVPASLLVLGGGVVGVEMAQAWRRLGAEVTMMIRDAHPLTGFEPFVGGLVDDGLRRDGVQVRTSVEVRSVHTSGGAVVATLSDGSIVHGEKLLLATGRRPASCGLGLEDLGVPGDVVAVDDTGLVSGVDGEWLYAVGDVAGRTALTHQGKYEARIVADALSARASGAPVRNEPWGAHATTADRSAVAQVVFTDPEVASVGYTLERAEAAGLHCDVSDVDFAVAGSALQADGYTGRARVVVDLERQVLVGATFVGQDTAELVHAATIAIVGEVRLQRLWHAVPAYPTMSEIWLRLLENYGL